MPVAIRGSVRIDRDAPATAIASPVEVVHLGQSALVLRSVADDRLLVITGPSGGLMPGGCCVGAGDFSLLRDALTARLAAQPGAPGRWCGWGGTAVEARGLRVAPAAIDARAVKEIRRLLEAEELRESRSGVVDPVPLRREGNALAAAALAGEHGETAAVLARLVGAGPGTTPTGDDVIAGVLAGLALLGERRAAAIVAAGLPRLLGRTTLASRHYLAAAVDGRFGEHVQELLSAASGRSAPLRAVARAARWGGSSGIDLLAGVMAAIDDGRTGRNTRERSA